MHPIKQTRFGEGKGNCLQAALASIFEVDIDSIPFFQGYDRGWYDEFSKWMIATFGLQPMDLEINENPDWLWIPRGYHLINGLSPRGNFHHSVVGRAGEMVHDPHPSDAGLREKTSFTVFLKVIE